MDNRIDGFNNVCFKARYLNVLEPEKFPKKVYEAIYKNDSIDEFLRSGKPKTLWGKFVDLFRKDEFLDVYYDIIKDSRYDTFQSAETVHFVFRKGKAALKFYTCPTAYQEGVRRPAGSIPKPGENLYYKEPKEYAEDKNAKFIEELTDFDKKLF